MADRYLTSHLDDSGNLHIGGMVERHGMPLVRNMYGVDTDEQDWPDLPWSEREVLCALVRSLLKEGDYPVWKLAQMVDARLRKDTDLRSRLPVFSDRIDLDWKYAAIFAAARGACAKIVFTLKGPWAY